MIAQNLPSQSFVQMGQIPTVSRNYPLNTISRNQDNRFSKVSALIVKVTHRCNLDCSYCYENITSGDDMNISTFKKLVDKVLENTTSKKISFILHGGEPTLMSSDWLSEAAQYVRNQGILFAKKVSILMQSNAIALDDTKIELLNTLGINIGVSIDGPSNLSNAMRSRGNRALDN